MNTSEIPSFSGFKNRHAHYNGKLNKQFILDNCTVNTSTGCWEYQGCIDNDGYARTRENYRNVRLHRKAYELWRGPIPLGLYVLHDCDNKKCCNPQHLHLGTREQNAKEAAERGQIDPNKGWIRKLSNDEVRSIRLDDRHWSEVCKQYQICQATFYNVRSRKRQYLDVP